MRSVYYQTRFSPPKTLKSWVFESNSAARGGELSLRSRRSDSGDTRESKGGKSSHFSWRVSTPVSRPLNESFIPFLFFLLHVSRFQKGVIPRSLSGDD